MGIPQRVLENLEDKLIKDMLNGKSESDAKQEIAARIGRPVDDRQVIRIYKQARNKSGLDYKVYEKSEDNTTVRQAQINEIVSSGITKIEQGGDNEEIINDVEYGYDLDHAMERIEQSAGFVKILFACKFPLTKKDMNKRKKLTGVKPT